jgi:alpha-tubulin suppressor-like RCC1 family protein
MAWGLNRSGELGIGTRDAVWTPTEVVGIDKVISIAAGTGGGGAGSSGAVREDGTVWMWGTGTAAMIGNGNDMLSPDEPGGRILVPTMVKGVTGATSIHIGAGHVGVLLKDGSLQLWGFDGYGQVGVGTRSASGGSHQTRPVKITGIANVATLYLGGWHSLAVGRDGSLWIWGSQFSSSGQGLLSRNLRVPTRLSLDGSGQ